MTLYLPDAVEKELRRAAKRAKKSLSAYLTELARQRLMPAEWPAAFRETYGSWKGEFPDIDPQEYEARDEF